MRFTANELARMVDLSAVRTDVPTDEVRQLAALARQYNCICAFAMPCYTRELAALLTEAPQVHVGVAQAAAFEIVQPPRRRSRSPRPASNSPTAPTNWTWS